MLQNVEMRRDSAGTQKNVERERFSLLDKWMETIETDENEIYKFLGVEQADGIKTKFEFKRVKSEVEKRVKMLANTELNDTNLIFAIKVKVILITTYSMNVGIFSKGELNELDQTVKR